jgi:hypothetical protein
MSSVRPGWEEEPVMTEWAKYAKSQMGELLLQLSGPDTDIMSLRK